MSKRTGPVVRGTRKDGAPRRYEGRLQKLRGPRPLSHDLLTIDPPSGFAISATTADGIVTFVEAGRLDADQLRAVDVGLDAYDAANEDAYGRLPHDPLYGKPLAAVIALPLRPALPKRVAA